jgi:hypothetical protein
MHPLEQQPNTNQTRAEAARINGSKSQGPVTAEGKARSSQNAIKTGIYSKRVVLPNENMNDFLALRASYFQTFKPSNPVETDLVEDMVNARWRIRRIETTESCNMGMGLTQALQECPWLTSREHPHHETAMAFLILSEKGKTLSTLARYEDRYRRAFDRALKTLQQLRGKSGLALPTYKEMDASAAEPPKPAAEPEPPPPPNTVNEGTNPTPAAQSPKPAPAPQSAASPAVQPPPPRNPSSFHTSLPFDSGHHAI